MRKKVIIRISLMFFVSFMCSSVWAQPVSHKYILDNGLTVVLTDMPSSSSVALYGLVKTGSATEGKYLGSGISHFVEHMLFKGTKTRGVGAVANEIKQLGGNINASTTYDYTMYTIQVPAGEFSKALDVLSDMLMNSQFDAAELEKERKVIFGEMRLYFDNPDRRLSQLAFENAYVRHPYRHPIIGYETLFANISREDVLDYYHSTYIPNNMIISIAGKFGLPESEIKKQLEAAFKDFPPKAYLTRNLLSEPDQIVPRRVEKEYPTDLTRMSMAYQGVGILDQDLVPMDVLAMILGQGASSRLYQEIYKKQGLVHSISAGNYTPMDKGLFEVESLLEENSVDKTIAAVKDQIQRIQKNGVLPQELAKVKRQVLSQHVFGNQTAGDAAYRAAIDEAFTGDLDFSEKYLEAVRSVRSDDIKRVAKTYLRDDHLTVAIIKPEKKASAEKKESVSPKEAEIEKFSLDNGLTILLREDHTVPIVSMSFVLNGGTRQETESNNGVANLTVDLWTKGTTSRSAKDISSQTESLGAGVRGFSGKNSFGLSLDCLSEDLKFGLDLLEDLIKNPTFPQEEFEKSREQIKASIRQREDNISVVSAKALRETLFLKHSFRLDTLGTIDSLGQLKRDDVVNYYQGLCVANNMVLAVFGDINKEEVLAVLKQKFLTLPQKEVSLVSQKELPPTQTREKNKTMYKEQAMVMVGFQAPEVSSQDRYGMEVLSSILGSPFNGRLFLRVREDLGQSYTLGGSYTPGIDMGMAAFFVSTTQENAEKVKAIVLGQIQDLQQNEVSDEELANTKAYLKGTFLMSLDTNSSVAFMSSLDELYHLGFQYYKLYPQRIEKVTKSDIKKLAQRYLDLKKGAVVLTLPDRRHQAENLSTDRRSRPVPQEGSEGAIH